MAMPGDAQLTVVLDLATFANGCREVDACAALRACQRTVARVLALCLEDGSQLQWLLRFVDSRVPPHAFTRVTELMKATCAGRVELHIKMHTMFMGCAAAAAEGASPLDNTLHVPHSLHEVAQAPAGSNTLQCTVPVWGRVLVMPVPNELAKQESILIDCCLASIPKTLDG